MESLPDDVMIHIFSFLPPWDLLCLVRPVCRAWRALALHRDAWKHVNLSYCFGNRANIFEMALRLAPCLHSLRVDFARCSPKTLQAMATTSCQVERLNIESYLPPVVICNFLRQQVPHTKYLTIDLVYENSADILAVIQDMALVELMIRGIRLSESDTVDRPFRNGCLKRLSVFADDCYDPLIESLVTTNAASLQEFMFFPMDPMPLTLKALRALNCKLKLEIPASWLQGIIGIDLSHLTVTFSQGNLEEAEIQGLRALSRGLICPSSVSFYYKYCIVNDDLKSRSAFTCLQEMGTLGRCEHVESISVLKDCSDSTKMTELPNSLSGLPNLRELNLAGMNLPGTWLDTLEGLTSLQLLDLKGSDCCDSSCWLPALWRLIARMPGLHVIKRQLYAACCLKSLSLPYSEAYKRYGLRGHCQAKCALCARYWHGIGGRWITEPEVHIQLAACAIVSNGTDGKQ